MKIQKILLSILAFFASSYLEAAAPAPAPAKSKLAPAGSAGNSAFVTVSPEFASNQSVIISQSPAPSDASVSDTPTTTSSEQDSQEEDSDSTNSDSKKAAQKKNNVLELISVKKAVERINAEIREATSNPTLIQKFISLAQTLVNAVAQKKEFISIDQYEKINEGILEKLDPYVQAVNSEPISFEPADVIPLIKGALAINILDNTDLEMAKKILADLERKETNIRHLDQAINNIVKIITQKTKAYNAQKAAVAQKKAAQQALFNQIHQKLINYYNEYAAPTLAKKKDNKPNAEKKLALESAVKALIDQLSLELLTDLRSSEGYSLLQLAVKYNCFFAVQFLIDEKGIDTLNLDDALSKKALVTAGLEIRKYLDENEDALYEMDEVEQQTAEEFWKKKQQQKALKQLKSYAKNNKEKEERDAKAIAHAQAKVETPALKKAVDKLRLYTEPQNKKLKDAATVYSIGRTQKTPFQAWLNYAKEQKNQRKQYEIYLARAQKFHKKNVLKNAFSQLKEVTQHAKKQAPELHKKELELAQRNKSTKLRKTFAAWKDKAKQIKEMEKQAQRFAQKKSLKRMCKAASEISQMKKDEEAKKLNEHIFKLKLAKERGFKKLQLARVQQELQQDLEQYYEQCNELNLLPDREAIIALTELAQENVPTAHKLDHYQQHREPILAKAYKSLREYIIQTEHDRQALESLMQKEYEKDVQEFQKKCAELTISYNPSYLAELTTMAQLTLKVYAADAQERINNYRAMRKIPLDKAYRQLENDFTSLKRKELMAVSSSVQKNNPAQLEAALQEVLPHLNFSIKVNSAQPTPASVDHSDQKHKAEAQNTTAALQQDEVDERDPRDAEKFMKSESHKLGATLLDKFVAKRKAKEALNHWYFADFPRCTVREKAIMKEEGASMIMRLLKKKQLKQSLKEKQSLKKAWQKLAALKTSKKPWKPTLAPFAEEQPVPQPAAPQQSAPDHNVAKEAAQAVAQPAPALNPQVTAFFNAWDSQQAAAASAATPASTPAPVLANPTHAASAPPAFTITITPPQPAVQEHNPMVDVKRQVEKAVKNNASEEILKLHMNSVGRSLAAVQSLAFQLKDKKISAARVAQLKALFDSKPTIYANLKNSNKEFMWHGMYQQLLYLINNLVDAVDGLIHCFNSAKELNENSKVKKLIEEVFAAIGERSAYYNLGNSAHAMIKKLINANYAQANDQTRAADLLITAVRANDHAKITELLKTVDIEGKNLRGFNALYAAVITNNATVTQMLLKHGAQITNSPNIISISNEVASHVRREQIKRLQQGSAL
jgi:hypothetical protein